jgi:outer membrane receptor protein involved in Fe transport
VRTQGERPLNRRNTFFTDSYAEFDAGASYTKDRYHLSVVGRNLGDDRHYVTESELGDSMFYVAAPLRVTAEVSVSY